jgi:carbon-monoxide dehydrogenase small subunit
MRCIRGHPGDHRKEKTGNSVIVRHYHEHHRPAPEETAMEDTVHFILNGKDVSLPVDGDRLLLWVLRTDLGLTGTKYGCGAGLCGSCTVLVDGEAVRSCQTSMKEVSGKHVTTIEGLAKDAGLHPVQKAFMAHDAMQCGYCTPGMIMTAAGFLSLHHHPTRDEIAAGMEDNLCRCGAHKRILEAVEAAAKEMEGGTSHEQ